MTPATEASPLFSPRGEAKCVRRPSVRGARRLAPSFLKNAGVLEPYGEHGNQAQRSNGGLIFFCVLRPSGGEKCGLRTAGNPPGPPSLRCGLPSNGRALTPEGATLRPASWPGFPRALSAGTNIFWSPDSLRNLRYLTNIFWSPDFTSQAASVTWLSILKAQSSM